MVLDVIQAGCRSCHPANSVKSTVVTKSNHVEFDEDFIPQTDRHIDFLALI